MVITRELVHVTVLLASLLSLAQAHFLDYEYRELAPRPLAPPPSPPPPPAELSPSQAMVDITNDLAYRVLHFHSVYNRDNFAFSPTALMATIVALYEGSAGRSSLELRNCVPLPGNRDTVRVGYRDIHRRLRAYFFNTDNPLSGLSLNKENVTITQEYESILKFYGYDLGVDMVSSSPPQLPSSPAPAVTVPSVVMPQDGSTTEDTPTISTTEVPITSTTEAYEEETTTVSAVTTETTEKEAFEEETTTASTADNAEDLEEDEEEEEGDEEETTEESVTETLARFKATPEKSEKLLSPQNAGYKYTPPKSQLVQSRSKRHLFGGWRGLDAGWKGLDANFYVSLVNPSIQAEAQLQVQPQTNYYYEDQPLITANPKPTNGVINHVFYLNSDQIVHTTYKVYNSVLYYKYLDTLKVSVLELELDSSEYNLMIMLPDYHVDLGNVVASLKYAPGLRALRKQLKPKWVQAIIPDFKLQGNMFLTSDLQNMGISDIFEPTRADFRPMTDETGIYVKHIEQSINVNIRTRQINHSKRNIGGQTRPIEVSVNHPFLFFVVDRDLDVATMAGRVLNPLNVRIQ